MKVSEVWLREYTNPKINTEKLVEQLTMAGLEVDGAHPAAPAFNNIVIARITAVDQHPNADKLKICQVDAGDKDDLQIVTNVATVKPGMKVALAKIGAKLPDGLVIKETKLRDELSQGMFGGVETLGLGEVSEGLLTFPSDAPVGKDVRDFLQLDDQVISVDLTPNRGDCLSVLGVARDVAAINGLTPPTQAVSAVKSTIKDQLKVHLDHPEACPRYVGRVVKNINPSAVTPTWIKERLRRVDIRPISPVVDVLNYVMIEMGQPMHAFDLEKLQGDVHVRWASKNEKLTLLNDDEVKLNENTLVIADDKKVVAMAGIMGGLDTSVTDAANHIFLESAFFTGPSIIGRSRCYSLHTESAYRFERGVDYMLPEIAMERATQLLQSIVGGDIGPIAEVVDVEHLPKEKTIKLAIGYCAKVLGIDVDKKQVISILKNLGMAVEEGKGELIVHVPSYRFDIAIAQDLVEEVARIYGYNNIPVSDFVGLEHKVDVNTAHKEDHFKSLLQNLGYNEAITYSFIKPDEQKILDPETDPVKLLNPISSDMAVMRTSLWPGLINAMRYNLNRQQSRVRLFEIGQRFIAKDKILNQETMLSGLICGTRQPESWSGEVQKADFYDLKGDLDQLFESTQQPVVFKKAQHPALHPGQCAEICLNGQVVGHFGALHPLVAQKLGIKTPVYLFEILFDGVNQRNRPTFKSISKFPAIRRDFAIVVDEQVSANDLINKAEEVVKERLIDHVIFDIFTGEAIGANKKSVAIGLTLQDPDHTLTDDEVVALSDELIALWKTSFNATLRD